LDDLLELLLEDKALPEEIGEETRTHKSRKSKKKLKSR